MCLVLGETLHIWVGADLDEVTRERYIQDKLEQYGIEPRRRGLVALLPPVAGHSAGYGKPVSTAAIVGGSAVAIGIAAAAIMPAVLDDNHGSASGRPPAATPARGRPRLPAAQHPPVPPSRKPPEHAQAPGVAPQDISPTRQRLRLLVRNVPVSVTPPTHVPGVPALPPHMPIPPALKPPPVTRKPAPLLALSLHVARLSLRSSPRPLVHVRIGKPSSTGIGIRRFGSNLRGPDAEYGSTR